MACLVGQARLCPLDGVRACDKPFLYRLGHEQETAGDVPGGEDVGGRGAERKSPMFPTTRKTSTSMWATT